MRPQPVVVHLRRHEHVRCVADALADRRVRIHDLGEGRWDLHVDIWSRSLGDLLAVLHECLLENEIPLVRLTVDGRTYAMEPASRDAEGSSAPQRVDA